MNTFATRLKQERTSRSWSQEQLAEHLGTTRNTVSLWERGLTFPTPYFRQQLSALFEQPLEALGLLPALTDPSTPPPTLAIVQPDLLEASPVPPFLCWHLPAPRNPLFSGREAILSWLRNALHHDQARPWSQIQAITGLGGMGKTQIALEYIYRSAQTYRRTFWLRAETREILWADLVALAEDLQLVTPQGGSHDECIKAVQYWLQEHCGWLLVVDNLEEMALLREFLPVTHCGSILVTTRVQATGPGSEQLNLDKMSAEEGALLLLRRIKRLNPTDPLEQAHAADRSQAMTLAEMMDGLPLALDQAGAYIEESACSLEHYVDLFQQHQAILLGLRTLSGCSSVDHPRSVHATLALSLERLQRVNPAALALLQLCAFLHAEAIPEELLQKGIPELGTLLEGLARNPLQLDATMADLRRYSLLQRDFQGDTVSLHRLVQVVVQYSMDEATQRQWAERAVRLVACGFPQQVEYENWEECQRLLPHALRCADLIRQWNYTFPEAAQLLNQTGDYLRTRGAYTQALPLYERALAMREQTLGPTHPDVATSLNNLALGYYILGRYDHALPLYQRALAMREQTLGPTHPDVAVSLNNLAILYYKQGRYDHALPLYQRALAMREQTLGPTHPDTAWSLNNLAILYYEQGRYDHALPLYQRALAIREQTLGPTHPDVAVSLNNLAILYHEQGQDEEVLPLYQRALTIFQCALGPTHPAVARCLSNLAEIYQAQGKYEQTLPLCEQALAIDEQAYGPTHAEVATDLNSLAVLYQKLEQYEEALPLFERELAIRKQTLGLDHPDVGRSLNNLAELHRIQGQYEQAVALAQRALAIFEQAYGASHPDVAESLNTLATLYHAQGRYEQALPLYQRALGIREQVLEPTHPSLASCLDQYAALLRDMQQFARAEVVEIRTQEMRA